MFKHSISISSARGVIQKYVDQEKELKTDKEDLNLYDTKKDTMVKDKFIDINK